MKHGKDGKTLTLFKCQEWPHNLHLLVHKKARGEAPSFECQECLFTTLHKSGLKRHAIMKQNIIQRFGKVKKV